MAIDQVLSEHLKRAVGFPQLDITATVVVGGVSFEAMAVVAITRRERYIDDVFEDSTITLATTPSQYTELIQNGHENITIVVNRRPYSGGTIVSNRYRAVLKNYTDTKLEGNQAHSNESGEADKMSFSTVSFQLIPISAYDLRLREVGGIFRDAMAYQVIEYFLSKLLLKDTYSREEYVGRIETDKGMLDKRYSALVVKEGIPLLSMVDYIDHHYGVSTAGIGWFLKRQVWYVFRPYDTLKYQEDVEKLTVINAPPSRYSQLEKNYTKIGKTLTVACTGETRHIKHSDMQALNGGVGLRFASLDAIMPTGESNSLVVDPKDYITSVRTRDYGNEYNRVATSSERFTDNIGKELSKLAFQAGEVVETIWENGSIDLLVPGMATKFIFEKNGKLMTMHGTLLSAEELTNIPHGGLIDRRYVANVKLTLFLKRD